MNHYENSHMGKGAGRPLDRALDFNQAFISGSVRFLNPACAGSRRFILVSLKGH